MSDTKSEIIKHSVLLFNKKGFFNVSVNEIASFMGISPGNFTYHFKRKEYLLSSIQEEILHNSIDIMPKDQYITLAHFEEMFKKFYVIQQKYCFFFLDINYLIAEYPKILNSYKTATRRRFTDARKLVDHFIASGRLIAESDRVDYDIIIHNLWMVSTFWSSSTLLIDKENNSSINALWAVLSPYLTKKGYNEYVEIVEFNEIKNKY